MSNIEKAIELNIEQLEQMKRLIDDELFIEIDSHLLNLEDIDDWFFDNDMITKRHHIGFSLPDGTKMYINGYWFKRIEDAMAFKLRWL